MHTHILAFMEPKLFLVCGLIILLIFVIGYISISQRDAFYYLPEFRCVLLDEKTVLYIVFDPTRALSKDKPKEIENLVNKLKRTGSRPISKEELDKALAIDPSLLNPFTSVVVIIDNKPAVIEYQKKDRELLGFAIIKKPA